jgi:hypothetical protein
VAASVKLARRAADSKVLRAFSGGSFLTIASLILV